MAPAPGDPVPVVVDYDVKVDPAGRIEGWKTATETSGDATCTYAFSIDGQRG